MRVDGQEVPFNRTRDEITVTLAELNPGDHRFELFLPPAPEALPYRPSLAKRVGIALRRTLSEFRDRVLAREVSVLRFAQHVARMLRLRA